MLTSIIYSINFATMGMYAYILNNMKTTTKINQKSQEREGKRERETVVYLV